MSALATMILAVMTRVALGHTGRPLVVRTSIAVAYLLLSGGAGARHRPGDRAIQLSHGSCYLQVALDDRICALPHSLRADSHEGAR